MKTVRHLSLMLFTFLICSYTHYSLGQNTFSRTYNKGNSGYAVREVNGNSYVVAGSTDFYYNFHWFIMSSLINTNLHLFKTDANGVLIWEKIFSKPNTRMIARWLEPTNDNGFILTGASNSDMVWPPDSNDIILVKTDAAGTVQWSKTYDTSKDELGFCVQQTNDSGYIVSGFYDAQPVSIAGNTYIILIKTDNNGNIQWEKKYQFAVRDFNTHEPFSYVVKQTADGGYVVTGTTANTHPADLNVMRTDASGNLLWAKSFDHDNSSFRNSLGMDIIETPNGDFLIAGSMDKTSPNQINYPYFLKISSSGSVIKARFFETVPALMFQSGFSSVIQTADGGYFFTGMGGYSNFGDQAQLLKTDANLDMTWSRVYTVDGAATLGTRSGRQTSDGGFIFSGKKQMAGTVLLKTNNLGLINCKTPGTLTEFIPSLIVPVYTPTITSGINVNPLLLNTTTPLADTTVTCPLNILIQLPVNLLSFSAEPISGDINKIEWVTSSETNNSYFSIEKSIDQFDFNEVGRINGAGNSGSNHQYSFYDYAMDAEKTIYYRLRQTDYNGNSKLSHTVSVKQLFNNKEDFEYLYDSYNKSITVTMIENSGKPVCCSIVSVLGLSLLNETISTNGNKSFTISTTNIPHGMYLLTVKTGSTCSCRKIVL